jgi:hypothetical protein
VENNLGTSMPGANLQTRSCTGRLKRKKVFDMDP